ncbi:MAG: universal stress protein [Desulfuromonas sp.]|nr:MAG: universal stress protein [Desulfuromonas sp.]
MLPLYRNILVTTDFSPNSEFAFKHAVMLARQNNAKIHLLHVLPQIDSSMRGYLSAVLGKERLEEFEHDNLTSARDTMKKDLELFAKTELLNYPEDFARFAGAQVVLGQTVPKILETAAKLKADVIVIGNHGQGILEHAFLGSVAEKLLQKSTLPVFVVPLPN